MTRVQVFAHAHVVLFGKAVAGKRDLAVVLGKAFGITQAIGRTRQGFIPQLGSGTGGIQRHGPKRQ